MQTNSDFQMSQSSECASEKCGCQFMVFNSVQTYKEYCATRETYAQAESLNHPVSIFVYNLPLESSISNSQILVNNCETNDIRSQFSTVEVSTISNSWNNNRDFTIDGMDSDSSVLNKTGLNVSSKVQQEKSNVKIDQQLSKITQAHGEEINFNPEFEPMIIVPIDEMVSSEIRLSELSHKPSASRQIVHGSARELILENMLCPLDSESTCPICQKEFRSKKDLKRHYKTHPGIEPAVCSICQQIFSDKYKLKRHIAVHIEKKTHKCKICGKFFRRKEDLGRHIRIHTGEKAHKCNTCGKLFARKDGLGIHIRIHTGEKPHKCNTCEKLFARKDDLGMHIRIHTGEKRHKCDICKMLFTKKHTLIRHVKRRHKIT